MDSPAQESGHVHVPRPPARLSEGGAVGVASFTQRRDLRQIASLGSPSSSVPQE